MEKRWKVYVCGDLEEAHRTREAAREGARWWRRHPAIRDRHTCGVPMGQLVEVRDSWAPDDERW